MASAKDLWNKSDPVKQKTDAGKQTTSTTADALSDIVSQAKEAAQHGGPAGAAVNDIVTQAKQAYSRPAQQSSVTQMLQAAAQSPYQTVAEAIRAGKQAAAQPTTGNNKTTTPPASSAGSGGITAPKITSVGKEGSTYTYKAQQAAKEQAQSTLQQMAQAAQIKRQQDMQELSTSIKASESRLTNWKKQLDELQAAYSSGDDSAAEKYSALAEKYNKEFDSYTADIGKYNSLYKAARDSSVRSSYGYREYEEQREQMRDAGVRQEYHERRLEQELTQPRQIEVGKEATRTVTHTPGRGEQMLSSALSDTSSGLMTAVSRFGYNLAREDGGKGRSAAEESWRTKLSTEVPAAASYWSQCKAGVRDWADGLITVASDLQTRGEIYGESAKAGLGPVGTFLVDAGIAGIQWGMDVGLSVVSGGSMLTPMFLRSFGSSYLDKRAQGYSEDAAEMYGLGIGAVEALSEKMFGLFGIAEKFAKGVVTREMSERIIDGLVKRLATTPKGRTWLNRGLTLLFATGSEGLEEVVSGVMEPHIRKWTLDHDIYAWGEVDWQEALYEGLIGAVLGQLGGAVDVATGTGGVYRKYYRDSINEGIGRYVEAVRQYGLGSEEAIAAADAVWEGGTRATNQAVFTIDGEPVTAHQMLVSQAAQSYGLGEGQQGPSAAASLSLRDYLTRQAEERARLEQEAGEDSSALPRNDINEAAPQNGTETAGAAEEGTVRLDTEASAAVAAARQGGEFPGSPNGSSPSSPAGGLAETSRGGVLNVEGGVDDIAAIPEKERTQEEQDELDYGAGAVADLGQHAGLAERLGRPEDRRTVTNRVDDLAARLRPLGLRSLERAELPPDMNGVIIGDAIYIDSRLSDTEAEAAAMGHEVVHFAKDADPQLIADIVALMQRQGRDVAAETAKKQEVYRRQFQRMGIAWDEAKYDQAYFEEEVAADFIGEICRRDSRTLDRIAATEEGRGLLRRIADALKKMLARIGGRGGAVYEQAIERLNAALAKSSEATARPNAGPRMAYGGVQAANADLEALNRAEEMESQGEDALTIFRETGWFRGMEGMWKFEVDDSGMQYSRRGDLGFREQHPEYDRFRSLQDRAERAMLGLDVEPLSEAELAELNRLAREWGGCFRQEGRIAPDARPADRLSDYFRHDELFANYPQLREARLEWQELPEGSRGGYNIRTNTITLSESLRHAPEDTIVHEVQHAIQKIEGFAKGSNPEYWDEKRRSANADLVKARQEFWNDIRVRKLGQRVETGELDEDLYDETLNQMLEDDPDLKEIYDRYRRQENLTNRLLYSGTGGYEMYRNTAGEVEARDVEDRRTWSKERRRQELPYLGDENTVFVEGDGGMFAREGGGYDEETASIKNQLRNSQDRLNNMEPVASVMVPEDMKSKRDAAAWAVRELAPTGYQVDKLGYGVIYFTEKDIISGMRYAKTQAEKAAIVAMPKVLKRGIKIGEHNDHKSRGKQTITFAAPVVLNGIRGNMAVVVNRNGNHYYTHRILMPDGTVFTFTENRKDVTQERSRGVTVSSSLADTTSATSNAMLSDADRKVKPDVRFSLSEPVEESGSLVALHNLSAVKLDKALDLGGFPMPSIAVTRKDIPHTNFGDITLVMDRSTVDPEFDRRNEVYSADAWTPTFPQVEYEADSAAEERLSRKFYDMQSRYGREAVDALYSYGTMLSDQLNRHGGAAGIIDLEKNNTEMKKVYLLDSGRTVPEPVVKETVTRLSDDKIALYESLLNSLDENIINEAETLRLQEIREFFDKYETEIKAAFRKYYIENGVSELWADATLESANAGPLVSSVKLAARYRRNGPETKKTEPDYAAARKAIEDSVDQADYERWLHDLFDGTEGQSGVYNGRAPYTASGNLRSFKSTHYPVTLDNIARAMAAQNGGNSKNTSGFHGVKTLRGGTATVFKSIPQMHELEGRLRNLTDEEAEEINDALSARLSELMGQIYERRTYRSASDNIFIDMDTIGEIMEEVAETGSWRPDKIKKTFAGYSYDLGPGLCQGISDLLTDINNMPVHIFEAKPKRAVRFDEVRAAIVPEDTDPALIDRLREAGVEDIRTYTRDDTDSRLEAVNAVPEWRFSLNEEAEEAEGLPEASPIGSTSSGPAGHLPLRGEGLELEKQLRESQRREAYWRKQAKRTEAPSLREKDVERLTRDLLKAYGSRARTAEMTARLKELGEYILSSGADPNWSEVQTRAEVIAADVLEQAEQVDDGMWRETAEFRRYLRTTTMKVSDETYSAFDGDYNAFRKKYFGRLNLSRKKGPDVSIVYSELAHEWPALLPDPDEVNDGHAQLMTIAHALDNVPPRRYNPYKEATDGTDLEAARELLAGDIIDGLMSENVRQEPPTAADKAAAEQERRQARAGQREDERQQRIESAVDELEAESGAARHRAEAQRAGEAMAPDELIAAAVFAKQQKKQLDKITRALRLTEQESRQADALLSGAMTPEMLPEGRTRSRVMQAYRARLAYREAQAPVDEYNRARREQNYSDAEDLTENSDEWQDKKNLFSYSRETARRIFYGLAKTKEEAEALIRHYIDPIREHEAAKNRMVNRYNKRIEALNVSTRIQDGNAVSEAYAVQFVGEVEFMIDWLESLPESAERDGVSYAEANTMLAEFWRENPNLDKDRIHAAVAEFRSIYDEIFAMVNEARVANGYAPIDYRKGYFPHFSSDSADNIIQSLANGMGIGVEVTELPTSIAGTTHLFRPGIQWSGHMLQRTGSDTDYNVLEGWDRYIPAVANIIYHTEDIQKLRALETVIRSKYSDARVRDEISAVRRSRELTSEEINAKLDELFGRDTTQLNYFVQWLREYTNQLAGKRAELDRNVEKFVGRKIYRTIQKVENRVAANMLGGNLSSAMTNFIPLFQAWANVRTDSMLRAMWDTGIAAVKGDGFRDGSDFLVNRRGYSAMYQTLYGRTKDALFTPFSIVDDFVSETVVRARYYDGLRQGLSPELALQEADIFAGGVMADRAVGELPTIFNSKNPLIKVFTMFQVEVNNDLSHLLKDIPRETRERGTAALFAAVIKYMLGVYMFNDLFEWLFGRRVSLDPLSMLNDLAGDVTGHELPNMFESAALIIKGEWQGWEEFESGKGGSFIDELAADAKDWAGNVPFISGLLGGGRFPIQAMLPKGQDIGPGLKAVADLLKSSEEQENPDAYDLSKLYKLVKNPLTYWAMPAFGGQARKVAEGIWAYTQHGSYSQTKDGRVLQYPILGYDDLVKSMIFGKTTTRYGKEWIESDFDSLTVPQTETWINLTAGGSDPELIYQILQDLKGTERTAADKAYALAAADLDDSERIALLSVLDRQGQADKFTALMGEGLSFRQCAEVLEEYLSLQAKVDALPEGDEDKTGKKRLATEFAVWLDDHGYDSETIDLIEDKQMYGLGAAPIRYDWLTDAGISRDGALELAIDWSELTPLPGKSQVAWTQKIEAVADAGYLSEAEKHAAVLTLHSSDPDQNGVSQQDKYRQYVMDYDIPVEVFNQFLYVTSNAHGIDADGDGKADSGTKRDAVFAAINSLPLQPGQKTALAFYQGDYKEYSIRKYAPWL